MEFWRDSVRSSDSCIISSARDSLGGDALTGKISIASEMCSGDFLGDSVCEESIKYLWEDVPDLFTVWCPGTLVVSLVVYQSSFTWGIHGGLVVIKLTIELCICLNPGVES